MPTKPVLLRVRGQAIMTIKTARQPKETAHAQHARENKIRYGTARDCCADVSGIGAADRYFGMQGGCDGLVSRSECPHNG